MTKKSRLTIKVKRVYEKPARSEGCRILVDRIWPRGLSKDAAALDGWMKEVAPSTELRKWFGHEPSRWPAFKKKYFGELDQKDDLLEQLLQTCSGKTVTLLFGAKDCEHNNAVALKEYLDRRLSSLR